MTTIADIAKRAKVAKSTVSLVINNTGYVSEETRNKINKAIQELNYVPNALAQNLSLRKSNMVGIMVPDIANPFFAEFLKYVENELYLLGYKTMICNTSGSTEREKDYLEMLQRKFMDGLIIGQYELPAESYTKLGEPIVSLDRTVGGEIPMIRSDHKRASELVAEEMIRNGCRKVVVFVGRDYQNGPATKRHVIIRQMLEKAGIQVMTVTTETPYHIEHIVKNVFDENRIDGAAGADLYVLSCLKEAYRRGLQVPDEFCAVSYDGTLVTQFNTLQVTTIVQPVPLLAKRAVQILNELMMGNRVEKKEYILDVTLREGDTTKKSQKGIDK